MNINHAEMTKKYMDLYPQMWQLLTRVNCSSHWLCFCFSTGEWGDWQTQHQHGRWSSISAPYRNGAHLIEEKICPSIKRRMSFPLHQVLSQLLTVFIFNVNILFCLAKPSPDRKCPSFVCPLTALSVEKLLSHFATDSLYLTTEGEETTQPGSDNILFCRICCLFVHFNNSYKIKKKVKGLDFLSGYIVQPLKEKIFESAILKPLNLIINNKNNKINSVFTVSETLGWQISSAVAK